MELRDKNIFILGLARYGSAIESTTYTLARQLAKNNQVFYIENPYTWKDVMLSKDNKQQRKKYAPFSASRVVATDTANLKLLVLPLLPSINWLPEGLIYRSCLSANQRIITRAIHDVIAAHKIANYIFINSFNFYYPDLGKMLRPDITVYHCVDPIVHAVEKKHGLVSENKVVKESDLVVCTSKQLYNEKISLNKNTYFIPNAADINHSGKALNSDVAVHSNLDGIKRPIVGYFGNIERRLDYNLLDAVTASNPEVSFVFAGPVTKEYLPSWFHERANVFLTGAVPYDSMPRVLKGFDVAMIPFKSDEFSATIFPLKLFEYLGAGKPVVATNFNPDLQEFTDSTVAFCDDAKSFSNAIQEQLQNDSDTRIEQRITVASQNTWEQRGLEFSVLINKHLDERIMSKRL
jgi:teichuronic acid biosynthesis glycosyltransferase TuaH